MSVFNEANVNGELPAVSGSKVRIPVIPIGDVVMIELHAMPDRTAGGLILPEMRDADPRMALLWGTVVAVGLGVYSANGVRIPVDIQVGDVVFLPQVAAIPLNPAFITMLALNHQVDPNDAAKIITCQCQHVTGKIA